MEATIPRACVCFPRVESLLWKYCIFFPPQLNTRVHLMSSFLSSNQNIDNQSTPPRVTQYYWLQLDCRSRPDNITKSKTPWSWSSFILKRKVVCCLHTGNHCQSSELNPKEALSKFLLTDIQLKCKFSVTDKLLQLFVQICVSGCVTCQQLMGLPPHVVNLHNFLFWCSNRSKQFRSSAVFMYLLLCKF